MKYFFAKKQRTYKNGFSLIEVLVAASIFTIISAVLTGFIVYYFQAYSFSFDQNQAINSAQTSLTTLIREIREARNGENGAYPIVQTNDNTFIFYSDITNDGRSDLVKYFIENNQIKKSVIEPTEAPVSYPIANEKISIIANNVDNETKSLFTYYNGDWPQDTLSNPLALSQRLLNTRFVSIYVKINASTQAQPFELTSSVQIRSLKDNL